MLNEQGEASPSRLGKTCARFRSAINSMGAGTERANVGVDLREVFRSRSKRARVCSIPHLLIIAEGSIH